MIEIDNVVLNDVEKGFSLPPKPELLTDLHDLLQSDEPELGQIADLIATDVATSAAVLKVINSSSYGFSRTITDIRQAVMFLGLNSVTHLVTGFLLKQAFDQSQCCISLERFWDTANEISEVAMIIGRKIPVKIPLESLHMLGLFHDAGIPAMALKFDDYANVLSCANSNYDMLLVDQEEAIYNTNHATIGYFLANSWNLPKPICKLILRHHDMEYFKENHEQELACTMATLKMAEHLVQINKRFVSVPDWAHIKADVLHVLELDEDAYQDIKDDVEEIFN
ncbi:MULTISPECIES: HDOD domain-containing protein [Pseudoalteromonas]|uniref:HDOD domain-containing protein n=1 Tax=Pseudoalteromonas obscura TaxID=3048491 RepID=A0ABT7EJP2_9GAMM|nr:MULTISPECIES: HDOD domain-containing protein [Pseudoalteromonas]MBQ4836832.1 HDOD domain-containing protein [Pseudoalteromonas luteoviolacea]MDK2595260.1 HDOD domain-containing protein [Pseudoalteromonas sp. P94(2023)]